MACKRFFFSSLCVLFVFFIGCASVSNFSAIDKQLADANHQQAVEYLEKNNKSYYSLPKDDLLYKLDFGMLNHYAENYEQSNQSLSEAEALLFELYGTSISQEIGSAIINDNVKKYTGEDYEDIYINIFKAINFINQGQNESAFVEIRRANNKIKGLQVKYQKDFEKARAEIEKNGGESPPLGATEFNNSALANYLSILMYRADKDLSNAKVSHKQLEAVYKEQPSVYGNLQIPRSISEEFSVPSDKARLNFLAFTGIAPKKVEVVEYIPFTTLMKVALPKMELRGSKVASVEILVNGNPVESMEKIESIENIALDTFNLNYSVILARTMARVMAKAIAETAVQVMAGIASENENEEESPAGFLLSLLGLGMQVANIASENADVRAAHFFPAHAYVQGLTLDEGLYDITFLFKNSSGHILYQKDYPDFAITIGKLNLIEAFCIQ